MKPKGFTLIELLIVVAIIGIIAAIAIPNLMVAIQKGKQKATMGDMNILGKGIESYITDYAMAPRAANVAALNTSWFSPFYIKQMPIRDAWGTIFAYTYGTTLDDMDVYSVGSSGRMGSGTVDWTLTGSYKVFSIHHFENDIIYSNGVFVYGPLLKQ